MAFLPVLLFILATASSSGRAAEIKGTLPDDLAPSLDTLIHQGQIFRQRFQPWKAVVTSCQGSLLDPRHPSRSVPTLDDSSSVEGTPFSRFEELSLKSSGLLNHLQDGQIFSIDLPHQSTDEKPHAVAYGVKWDPHTVYRLAILDSGFESFVSSLTPPYPHSKTFNSLTETSLGVVLFFGVGPSSQRRHRNPSPNTLFDSPHGPRLQAHRIEAHRLSDSWILRALYNITLGDRDSESQHGNSTKPIDVWVMTYDKLNQPSLLNRRVRAWSPRPRSTAMGAPLVDVSPASLWIPAWNTLHRWLHALKWTSSLSWNQWSPKKPLQYWIHQFPLESSAFRNAIKTLAEAALPHQIPSIDTEGRTQFSGLNPFLQAALHLVSHKTNWVLEHHKPPKKIQGTLASALSKYEDQVLSDRQLLQAAMNWQDPGDIPPSDLVHTFHQKIYYMGRFMVLFLNQGPTDLDTWRAFFSIHNEWLSFVSDWQHPFSLGMTETQARPGSLMATTLMADQSYVDPFGRFNGDLNRGLTRAQNAIRLLLSGHHTSLIDTHPRQLLWLMADLALRLYALESIPSLTTAQKTELLPDSALLGQILDPYFKSVLNDDKALSFLGSYPTTLEPLQAYLWKYHSDPSSHLRTILNAFVSNLVRRQSTNPLPREALWLLSLSDP